MYEREAIHRISERLGVVAQSVKLLDHPSLAALEAQHAALHTSLRLLLRRADTFDLYLKVDAGALQREAHSARTEGKPCLVSPEIPECTDGSYSWSELIKCCELGTEEGYLADALQSEMEGSHKSIASTNSTATLSALSTSSTTTSSGDESPEELTCWV